jgi:hypothetical protein
MRAQGTKLATIPAVRARTLGIALGAIVALLGPAALARADTTTSDNWSGYAAHRAGVKFRKVTAQWRQPSGICVPGHSSYSAFWVGIGGYNLTSNALEQIGSEFDCTATGHRRMSVWYELVPAPSRAIRMRVSPGDRLGASVKVSGSRVRLWLADLTRDESFTKTVVDRHVDATSAEWIAEAPSNCFSATSCQILRLADFGSVGFTGASAETTHYRWGSISNPLWNTTRIVLGSHGQRYVSGGGLLGLASPSALRSDGHAFSVDYTGLLGGSGGSGSGTVAGTRSLTRAGD